jgi:hypothetical protein
MSASFMRMSLETFLQGNPVRHGGGRKAITDSSNPEIYLEWLREYLHNERANCLIFPGGAVTHT